MKLGRGTNSSGSGRKGQRLGELKKIKKTQERLERGWERREKRSRPREARLRLEEEKKPEEKKIVTYHHKRSCPGSEAPLILVSSDTPQYEKKGRVGRRIFADERNYLGSCGAV